MQGMKSLSKQDLIDIINENFADSKEQDIIATFCYLEKKFTIHKDYRIQITICRKMQCIFLYSRKPRVLFWACLVSIFEF